MVSLVVFVEASARHFLVELSSTVPTAPGARDALLLLPGGRGLCWLSTDGGSDRRHRDCTSWTAGAGSRAVRALFPHPPTHPPADITAGAKPKPLDYGALLRVSIILHSTPHQPNVCFSCKHALHRDTNAAGSSNCQDRVTVSCSWRIQTRPPVCPGAQVIIVLLPWCI